jgi:hypothetical protein
VLRIPAWEGPQRAAATTPRLAPGGVRRTTSIDSSRPGGFAEPIVVRARARDAAAVADGDDAGLRVAEEVALDLTVEGYTGILRSIDGVPAGVDLRPLLGTSLRGGLRGRLVDVVPDEVARRSPLHTLLDDLPGALLVTGYSALRGAAMTTGVSADHVSSSADLCAGWAVDGVMLRTLREQEEMPVSIGPRAPVLEAEGGWHDLGPLTPHAMRRRRRIDLAPDGSVECFFRDSHVDEHGEESVVHEYTVSVVVDLESGEVVTSSAIAGALPWLECPGALASAGRLAGTPVDDLRARVRQEFTGTSTCTHLNDTLRVLADVPALAALLG